MAADYRIFKTPFFEIEISDPSGKRKVNLPDFLLRLVSKIEIQENLMAGEYEQPSVMTIEFIEGSREPGSPDYKMGTAGLYQIALDAGQPDDNVAGSLTNRAGIITDLRFSGTGGITFLTEQEKKTGKVDKGLQVNVQGNNTTRTYKSDSGAPRFLFQERNKIKVTWGYLESPDMRRSVTLSVTMVATNFPESGMPTTVITCQSSAVLNDQIVGKRSKGFSNRITVEKDGHTSYQFKDMSTEEVVKYIAEKSGMKSVVSNNFLNSVLDKDKQKILMAGESLHQFLFRLARQCGAYYEILPDVNGNETLYFISKQDMESSPIVKDAELLHWKGQGSILKSVNVSADFSALIGNSQKGINEKGEVQQEDNKLSEQLYKAHKSSETGRQQEFNPSEPTKTNANPTVKKFSDSVLGGEHTGSLENSPSKSKERLNHTSQNINDDKSRTIKIDFVTIGHPKFIPGIMEITGIGVRYSGKYRVINVTHRLDASGYTTSCSGISSFLGAGGVKVQKLQKAQEQEDKLVDERLLKYKKSKGISD